MANIFSLPASLANEEIFEALISTPDILVERIVSTGQTTQPGQWYDQVRDEWVIVLQGEAKLSYEDGSSVKLKAGDYLLIPSHQKHRVDYTTNDPPCIWLAIHGKL
jgi:cupin 2 domain-containing protein